jgi:AGCS family alanine or glycine:cation symporter
MLDTLTLDYLEKLSNEILVLPALILLLSSIYLTWKTRFIQIRAFPDMIKIFISGLRRKQKEGAREQTVLAHKALLTAISTTIGTSSIVSPIIAVRLGGPGALVGFLLAMLLGTAVSFAEVALALTYRKKLPDGTIMGGPMQYLADEISPFLARWYAIGTLILISIWSGVQTNTIADLLASYTIPTYATGLVASCFILIGLAGGIKRIANISEMLVPVMFVLYILGAGWIVLANFDQIPAALNLIFRSAFNINALAGGTFAGGIQLMLRWGLLRGLQGSEAGLGTGTFPHSMAKTDNPKHQGILAMASIYSHGVICFLSGLTTILTGTWQDASIPLGINIARHTFAMHFAYLGPCILMISAFLFSFGTILGNGYNGSQCFFYITNNKYKYLYRAGIALAIFFGAISDVRFVNILQDFCMIPVAIPHIIGIVILARRRGALMRF